MKKIPVDWELNVIIPNYKKGNTTKCGNCRLICLSSVALKIYFTVLETRLRNEIEEELEEEQSSFEQIH